ncbi:holo-ACP synthase [Chloroflexota bacterium]
MHHIGIDIIEIARIESAIDQWGERFLHRVYTEAELKLCRGKPWRLSARFAGKEAVMKTLGTGAKGVSWKEIEILAESEGKPIVHLHGKAHNKAKGLGLDRLAISLSDSKEYAIAFVIGETK